VTRVLLAALLLLAGLASAPASAALPENKVGLHMLLSEGRQPWPLRRWSSHIDLAAQAVGEGGHVL